MADATITVFITSISSSTKIKGEQRKVEQILSSKNYKLDLVDIAAGAEAKEKMREIAGNPKAMPPQIANGDQYCGDYDAFMEAVEDEQIGAFLKMS